MKCEINNSTCLLLPTRGAAQHFCESVAVKGLTTNLLSNGHRIRGKHLSEVVYLFIFFLFVWFFPKSALERFITQRCIMYRGQFFTRLRFFLEESQLGIFFVIFLYFFLISLFCFGVSAIFEKWSVIINLFQMSRCFFSFLFAFWYIYLLQKELLECEKNYSCWGFVNFLFFVALFFSSLLSFQKVKYLRRM